MSIHRLRVGMVALGNGTNGRDVAGHVALSPGAREILRPGHVGAAIRF